MAFRRRLLLVLYIFVLKNCCVYGVKTPYNFNDLLVIMAKDSKSMNHNDIQDILAKLKFENCTKTARKTECNRCLSAEDLGFNPNMAINNSEFVAKAPVIVYSLMPEKNAGSLNSTCDGIPSLPSKLFETLAYNFTHGKSKTITLHALEHILEKVNLTLRDHLHKKKCFSADSIFESVKHAESGHHDHKHDSNETGLDEHDFELACATIIFRLVQGYCIAGHGAHSKLPTPDFFMEHIFGDKQLLSESDLEKFTKKLNIAKETSHAASSSSDSHDGHDDHDGHDHRRKRRAAEPSKSTPFNKTCFSLDSMLEVFDIDHKTGASKESFKELCPAFLQQHQSGVCSNTVKKEAGHKDLAKIWGYGFLSVTIISLASLLGVATIPFIGKSMYKKVLGLLVSLAVGTLAGDAVLHLIPHAFGLHVHDETDSHNHDHGPSPYIWKALLVLLSIYMFYLFEVMMHFCLKQRHTHSHVDIEIPGPNNHLKKRANSCSKFEHHEGMPPSIGESPEKVPHDNGDIILTNVSQGPRCHSPSFHSCAQVFENYTQSESESEELTGGKNAKNTEEVKTQTHKKPSMKESIRKRSVFSSEDEKKLTKGISAVAWMIILGDTIHNISDGLAIGAAFSEGGSSGISGGISTSIAVFCHELPHELGDFAVLLTAGMSVKKALLANFLSACSCYIGLVIGIQVGQQLDVRLWIFAIAGGMFLYVALVDMLPDLMHSESLQTDTCQTLLYQNIGMILGLGIMLIIAVYEESIMSAVKI